jgi:hypothetical protein
VHGSGALVRWLLDYHLVDEITLRPIQTATCGQFPDL